MYYQNENHQGESRPKTIGTADVNASSIPGLLKLFFWDPILTLWRLAAFGNFWKTKHVALHGNIFAPVQVTDLVEASKDTASLLVCTRKKIFCLGVRVFCE